MSLRDRWVWNMCGQDWLVVSFKNGRMVRISSSNAENLTWLLEGEIAEGGT